MALPEEKKKPISRYGISPGTGHREGELEIVEAPEGEWVRYEDIKHLLQDEPTCGSMNARGQACDLPRGHGGLCDWEDGRADWERQA
jgi:hypothetical protein